MEPVEWIAGAAVAAEVAEGAAVAAEGTAVAAEGAAVAGEATVAGGEAAAAGATEAGTEAVGAGEAIPEVAQAPEAPVEGTQDLSDELEKIRKLLNNQGGPKSSSNEQKSEKDPRDEIIDNLQKTVNVQQQTISVMQQQNEKNSEN